MALSVAEGVPVKAIAGMIQKMPEAVISLAESNIKTPKDVEGKRMAYTAGSSGELLFPAFAAANGVDESKVTKLTVEAGAKTPLIIQGKADFQTDWGFTQAPVFQQQGKTPAIMLYADYGVNVLGHGLLTSADTLQNRPDTVKRFLAGSIRGIDEAVAAPEAALDAMVKYRPDAKRDLLLAQFKGMGAHLHTSHTEGKPTGWQATDDWQQSIDLLLKYMGLKKKLDPTDLFTNSFLPGG
jgi:NitT/TauT family transport system substrate-binding protein